jgi:hypothetical protein
MLVSAEWQCFGQDRAHAERSRSTDARFQQTLPPVPSKPGPPLHVSIGVMFKLREDGGMQIYGIHSDVRCNEYNARQACAHLHTRLSMLPDGLDGGLVCFRCKFCYGAKM